VIVTPSEDGFAETMRALVAAIEQHGLTVVARIDHAAGARAAGLELAAEQVVIFGNPRSGTPLMQADPRIGLELPLRMLVWQDASGVFVAHRDPRELSSIYDVAEQEAILDRMAALLDDLAAEATGARPHARDA
jgi:uncharacterized protein (DUF302 family)